MSSSALKGRANRRSFRASLSASMQLRTKARGSGAEAGPLSDSGERARLAVVPAGVQPGDQPVPDRDHVIGPIAGLPVPKATNF